MFWSHSSFFSFNLFDILVWFLKPIQVDVLAGSRLLVGLFVCFFARLFAYWFVPSSFIAGACGLSAQACCWIELCVDCLMETKH